MELTRIYVCGKSPMKVVYAIQKTLRSIACSGRRIIVCTMQAVRDASGIGEAKFFITAFSRLCKPEEVDEPMLKCFCTILRAVKVICCCSKPMTNRKSA